MQFLRVSSINNTDEYRVQLASNKNTNVHYNIMVNAASHTNLSPDEEAKLHDNIISRCVGGVSYTCNNLVTIIFT